MPLPFDLSTRTTASPAIRMSRRAWLGSAAAAFASTVGCMRYRLGSGELFRQEITSVHIPVFESDSYRRHLGEWLTEAVVKEVSLRTPYKVVGREEADSVLLGRLTGDVKAIRGYSPTDEGRIVDSTLRIEVRWTDRGGKPIGEPCSAPVPPGLAAAAAAGSDPSRASETTLFLPEFGQSSATAQQQVVQKLAKQIVGMMEAPW